MKHWLALLAFALIVRAQQLPKFEAASVKPSEPRPTAGGRDGGGLGCPQSLKVDGGRFDFECAGLISLIGYAYRISTTRVTGPDWMSSLGAPRFDVVAKLPDGAQMKRAPEMLQALLADRFNLRRTAVPAPRPSMHWFWRRVG
jgi:uncharacterized protein (TIGR03435 family)